MGCLLQDIGSLINTNMYLESMHKVLKCIYLNGRYLLIMFHIMKKKFYSVFKGKTCKRLDKTLHVLLKFARDKQSQRVIILDKGKVTEKISKINKSHSTALSTDTVITKNSNDWIVQSNSNIYAVSKISSKENYKCILQ